MERQIRANGMVIIVVIIDAQKFSYKYFIFDIKTLYCKSFFLKIIKVFSIHQS